MMVGLAPPQIKPLICAAFGSLICADQRNAVSDSQRFIVPYGLNFLTD
jgi:hypothetical protein